ncbi:MAG: hypothetical protein IIW54_13175 [Lachnospiraceae bacterium]|nr:hypothetical protein [Lachnospiraceae bacterium]
MKKTHSHENIARLIAGEEEEVMKALLSIDRVFEALCTDISDEKGKEQDELIARRQYEENATNTEVFIERLLVQCIGFWRAGLIQNVDDLRGIVKISFSVEMGEQYYDMLKNMVC